MVTYKGARNGFSLPPKRSCPDSLFPLRPPPAGHNRKYSDDSDRTGIIATSRMSHFN